MMGYNISTSTHILNNVLPLIFIIIAVHVALHSEDVPGAHMVCPSLESAMESLQSPPLSDKIESVFVLGGARAYEVRPMRGTLQRSIPVLLLKILRMLMLTFQLHLTPICVLWISAH